MPSRPFSHILLLLFFLIPNTGNAQEFGTGISDGMAYRLERIASDFEIPWGMDFINENEMLITSRKGKLSLLNIENKDVSNIKGLPDIHAKGQGGLMDVKVGPNYKKSGWIYFTYAKPVSFFNGGETTLARAKISGDTLTSWQDLLITTSKDNKDKHYGSRIAFDGIGHVYFGVGDRGHRPNAQDLGTHAGSIIRLNMDGSIPADNPFIGNSKALNEIWSFGHRNPQGLVYDLNRGILWSNEHGPRGGDEINLIKKGANYGWPITSHGKEYLTNVAVGEATEMPDIESPKKVYIPSIAPGSLMIYQGSKFPNWYGHLFSAALKLKHINVVSVTSNGQLANERRLFNDLDERIRHIIEGPQGNIYFSTDKGNIYRISPA